MNKIIIENYKSFNRSKNDKLGSGSFGYVYKNNEYAIKISKDVISKCENYLFCTIREISVMVLLQKYKIVPSIYRIELGHRISITMDLFKFSLNDLIKNSKLVKNVQPYLRKIMFNIICSLACAQTYGILHRDVKPDNILLNLNFTAKLTDWGLTSIQLNEFKGLDDQSVQTIWYRCPEYLLNIQDYYNNFSADMWSIGIIMLEILTGKIGFIPGLTKKESIHYILINFGIPTKNNDVIISERINTLFKKNKFKKSSYLEANTKIIDQITSTVDNKYCGQFIKSCLEWSPLKRLDPITAINHPFFSDLYINLNPKIKNMINRHSQFQKIELHHEFLPLDKNKIMTNNPNYLSDIRQQYLQYLDTKNIEIYACCVMYLDKLYETIDFCNDNMNINVLASVYFLISGMASDVAFPFKELKAKFSDKSSELDESDLLDFTNSIIKLFGFPIVMKTICTFRECFNIFTHDSLKYIYDKICLYIINQTHWLDLTSKQIFYQIIKKMNEYAYVEFESTIFCKPKYKKILWFHIELDKINQYIDINSEYNTSNNHINFANAMFEMDFDCGKIIHKSNIKSSNIFCCWNL